ncbi:molecular chaperone (small heat shock protein) [Candidatus Methanoperedens nitroreducens]|uniref:Molecular chaperone (Small heat shock protein) n=1 Tax=Candidatus Methanoperedens nitratireducens TaxID=1392998 RepID=A0A062V286_9EURY|nr:Hsp20/alpha crystallin family protein [Candidatus Methanoperedens nitroreducens]KCZ73231.1 molecular chaperone (small heat shock protein) [Candidatus Methanoperedens nitroreducens]MDJ1422821.1 Hsp20/alpha crystallin family protein [Candidatus Methanoperedens sp.]
MVDPKEDFRRFEEEMSRMWEDFWERERRGRRMPPRGEEEERRLMRAEYREPLVDVFDTEDEVIVTAEVPGLDKDDIKVYATGNRLEISSEKAPEMAEKEKEEREEKGNYIYRERSVGRFYRSITLPSTVNPDKSKTSYKHGVLEVRLPKTEVTKRTSIKID